MEELNNVLQEFKSELEKTTDIKTLDDLRVAYLGKKGKITELMGKIREIPNEQKREYGQKINQVKNTKTAGIFASCCF